MAKPRKTVRKAKSDLERLGFRGDVDTAGIALAQARGILDVLTVACRNLEIPDTYPGSLVQSLHAAMSEVHRAHEAIFGKPEVSHG